MRIPGPGSVFRELRVEFFSESPGAGWLWQGKRDDRFNANELLFLGSGFRGRVLSFGPPREFVPAPLAEIRTKVRAGEFRRWKAWVIGAGGSLGQVVSRAILAGGGEVCATTAGSICSLGRKFPEKWTFRKKLKFRRWDVLSPKQPHVPPSCTHVFYLATPPIRPENLDPGSSERPATYRRYFVEGLRKTLAKTSLRTRFFYPSTEFLNQPRREFFWYQRMKRLGENLCKKAARARPPGWILCPRLPRFVSSQTNGPFHLPGADLVTHMVPLLRGWARET